MNMPATLVLFLVSLLTAWPAAAGGVEPDPLTLRVNDATAAPGGLAAIVLRTYQARPIRQGQICLAVRLLQRKPAAAGKDAGARVSPGVSRMAAGGPFKSMEGGVVFSTANDAVELATFLPSESAQVTMLEFASDSATINATDGPLLVLYYRVGEHVRPGDSYEVEIDLPNTALVDSAGVPIVVDARNASLDIRAPTDPIEVSASAEVHDPVTVTLSLQTREPVAVSSGQLGIRYSQTLLPELPKVNIDPRHGLGQWETVFTRDLVVVQFWSDDRTLNTVPGDIVSLFLEMSGDADPGADRSVSLDPAFTYLYDAEGTLLDIALEPDVIP